MTHPWAKIWTNLGLMHHHLISVWLLSNVRQDLRHFYATTLRGEVDDANIQGYLRAASQIEDIWQQIDARRAELLAQGTAPWEAYQRVGYPLASIRSARTYQVFVQQLLAADAASDPKTAGFLPHVTYDQANALCHQIQPALQHAVAALQDERRSAPDGSLPLTLGPRIENEGSPCPVAHLQGMLAAAREVREWAAGLLAEYRNEIKRTSDVPETISRHLASLQGRLAQADSQLRFGVDLVGQVSQGEATPELHEEAENSLWDALQQFFWLNQVIALPDLLKRQQTSTPQVTRPHHVYRDRRIQPADLWQIAAPSARSSLRGTKFGTEEMEEMCEKMGGVLSAGAQQYLDEVTFAVKQGDALMVLAMANCPFEPLYRARRSLDLAGAHVPANHEFHWDFHRGHLDSKPRFSRVSDWQECDE